MLATDAAAPMMVRGSAIAFRESKTFCVHWNGTEIEMRLVGGVLFLVRTSCIAYLGVPTNLSCD